MNHGLIKFVLVLLGIQTKNKPEGWRF